MNLKTSKILIIRLGAIGDVVHTTNTYRAIKMVYPGIKIHYLTTKNQACFLENDSDIEKVIIVSKDDIKLNKLQNLAKTLKSEHYDLAINLQPNFKTRFLVFLSGIRKQLIYKKSFKMHAVENFFNTAQKYFKTLTLPDKMTLSLSASAQEYAQSNLKDLPRPLIVFNAGGIVSPRQGRTYPVEKWIQLGQLINKTFGGTIILTGAKEDEHLLKNLVAQPWAKSFIGKTTIEQNAAIIGKCNIMISGDSGPLHIATALNVPSIGLYGSMPVGRTGTYGHNCVSIPAKLACVPCNRRKCKFIKKSGKIYTPCMESIEPQKILEEVSRFLLT